MGEMIAPKTKENNMGGQHKSHGSDPSAEIIVFCGKRLFNRSVQNGSVFECQAALRNLIATAASYDTALHRTVGIIVLAVLLLLLLLLLLPLLAEAKHQ